MCVCVGVMKIMPSWEKKWRCLRNIDTLEFIWTTDWTVRSLPLSSTYGRKTNFLFFLLIKTTWSATKKARPNYGIVVSRVVCSVCFRLHWVFNFIGEKIKSCFHLTRTPSSMPAVAYLHDGSPPLWFPSLGRFAVVPKSIFREWISISWDVQGCYTNKTPL